ncbi:hypothetical protein J6590_101310, partial [Homalodisca vitripennis]
MTRLTKAERQRYKVNTRPCNPQMSPQPQPRVLPGKHGLLQDNQIKEGRAWMLLGWVTAERYCACKPLVVVRNSEVTFNPLVPRLGVREGFLALSFSVQSQTIIQSRVLPPTTKSLRRTTCPADRTRFT